jgi:hypothetical protein
MTSKLWLVLAASVLTSSASLAAVPLCSKVFRELSPQQISETVENIARMKLDLDLANVQTHTPMTSTLTPIYVSKLIELKNNLKGIATEAEIRSMIQRKIQELQGFAVKESEKVTEQKSAINELIRSNEARESYYVQAENPIEFKPDYHFYVGQKMFVMNDGNLLYNSGSGLHIYNPAKKKNPDLDLNLETRAYTTDGHNVYGVARDHFYIYDSIQARVKKFPLENFVGDFDSATMDLSPNRNLAILIGERDDRRFDFSVVDITTQKEVFTNSQFVKQVSEMKFLDDNHVLAIVNGTELHKIEISSGKTVEKANLGIDSPMDLTLSADRTQVAVFGADLYKSFEVSDLQTPIAAKAMLPGVDSSFYISTHTMPGSYKELLGYSRTNGLRVMSFDKLESVYDFGGKYSMIKAKNGSMQVFAAAIAPDKSKIYVLYTPDARRTYLDVWDLYVP